MYVLSFRENRNGTPFLIFCDKMLRSDEYGVVNEVLIIEEFS